MFGFLFHKKRDEVRSLLATRMNCRYFSQFRYGARQTPRGSFCEVVWVIPYKEDGTPSVERAFPVVTKDICNEGLALIHTQPVSVQRMLIAIQGTAEMQFLLCHLEHCTALGHGFYQIGVHPEEVIRPSPQMRMEFADHVKHDSSATEAGEAESRTSWQTERASVGSAS